MTSYKLRNNIGGNGLSCVTGATFFFYILYLLFFFLNLPGRISGLGLIRPTFLLFFIILVLLFLQRDKLAEKIKHPVIKAMGVFVLMIFLTLPFVTFPGSVLKVNFAVFLKAIVFLYFTALILDTEKRLKIALFVFVALQVFRVLEPLYLHITQGYWGSSTYIGVGEFAQRLSGAPADIINPNELGFVIVTAIPFLHYFLIGKGLFIKLLYFVLLALMLYALILTMSRGAFLALLVVGWFIFKESKRKFLIVIFGCLGVVAAITVMSDYQRDRYLSLVSSDTQQSSTAEGRITGAFNEIKLGFEKPIFGFGLGTTPEAKFHTWGRSKASHNMYGEILIETGLIGLFLFFKFISSVNREIKENMVSLCSTDGQSSFYSRLFISLNVVFWMFIVYSTNYWGLSNYYWYNLAGLVIAGSFLMRKNN